MAAVAEVRKSIPEVDQVGNVQNRSTSRRVVSLQTGVAILAAACIGLFLVLKYAFNVESILVYIPLYLTLLLGGLPTGFDLLKQLVKRELGTDVLAGVAIIASVLFGEYLVGSIIVLMYAGGASLEEYARHRAASVLDALAARMPRIAHKLEKGTLQQVALEAIAIGDKLVVLPHEFCPVDGVILEGRGTMDESYLTGEPFEIAKAKGSQVLSGAINGASSFTIQATKLAVDSRYASIMRVMQDAEQRRPRLRRLGDRLAAWYVPLTLLLALTGWLWSGSSDRFLAVVVVATPCPLLIGIPVAVIGAVSLAARRGIVIRNPAMLEQIDRCRTLIFDKTGTLTYGRPTLTDIQTSARFSESLVIEMAASLEQYSKHPLASAVLKAAAERNLELQPVSEISEQPGQGMRGIVSGHTVVITGRQTLPADQLSLIRSYQGGLECIVLIDAEYAATLCFRDEPRQESGSFVGHLSPRHGIQKVILLSGDRESEVEYLAALVGINETHSAKSPEEKLSLVIAESRKGPTLFVGDGINDAPAMQAATVGVAFGQNSDVTSEAADAVIMDASLRRVDELIHVGQRMRRIALQTAVGGMILSGVGMVMAASGLLPPVAGAVMQEVIDVIAVANALRVTLPQQPLTDF